MATKTAWKKVSPALAAAFDAALPASPIVERRQMFGCPCAFVNGNMFAGLHEDGLIVRVPSEAPMRPFTVMGRTMREYARFDDAAAMTDAERRHWVDRAFAYAAALPAKLPKVTKAAKALRPAARR